MMVILWLRVYTLCRVDKSISIVLPSGMVMSWVWTVERYEQAFELGTSQTTADLWLVLPSILVSSSSEMSPSVSPGFSLQL